MAEVKETTAKTKKVTKKIPANKNVEYSATGRRKDSVARVRIMPNGKGQFVINKKSIEEYFNLGVYRLVANQPFEITDTMGKYDVVVNVHGGGLSRPVGAQKAIHRALLNGEGQVAHGDMPAVALGKMPNLDQAAIPP